MGRKGKQPGGHNPLTYQEHKKLLGSYGTQVARLGSESQLSFGYCCLGLEPARDPVATPSGHIYSREAIVAYLLKKTKELKDHKAKADENMAVELEKQQQQQQQEAEVHCSAFLSKDQGTVQLSVQDVHATALKQGLKRHIDIESQQQKEKRLQTTSYWLAEYNPHHNSTNSNDKEIQLTRPCSPMSGNPLRLKDLVPIKLIRENDDQFQSNNIVKYLCSVSHQVITTQPVVAITKTGVVMLTQVYNDLLRDTKNNGEALRCPVTGKKFRTKDILHLKKAASGFAASGVVQARKYTPTLT